MAQLAAAMDVAPQLSLQDRSPANSRRVLVIAALIFATLSLAAGFSSDAFLEADACTHYLYSRFLFQEPYRIVDVWGRPVCTGIYAIPASLFGRAGTKVFSLIIALGVAGTAYAIARAQHHRRPEVAFVAVLAQPLVFLHSFTEMTELPFALLLGLAFWAFCRRRWGWAALLTGLLPLARPEGFGFVLMVAVALVLYRKLWALPLLLVGLATWNHVGWDMFGREQEWWRWLPAHWPYEGNSLYERGHPLKFLVTLPAVVSPMLFPALVGGMWLMLRRPRGVIEGNAQGPAPAFLPNHDRLCSLCILLIPFMILTIHSTLHAMGKMASNGELRYMLIVAPFWGLIVGRGLSWAVDVLRWRRPYLVVGAMCIVPPIAANLVFTVLPLKLQRDWQIAKEVAGWVTQLPERSSYPKVVSSHPGVYYYLDQSPTSWSRDAILKQPTPGTILVIDDMYASYNADSSRSITTDEIIKAGWVIEDRADHLLDIRPEPKPNETTIAWQFRSKWSNWRVFRSPD